MCTNHEYYVRFSIANVASLLISCVANYYFKLQSDDETGAAINSFVGCVCL